MTDSRIQQVLDSFTCHCAFPEAGQLDMCGKCGCFIPHSSHPLQVAKAV